MPRSRAGRIAMAAIVAAILYLPGLGRPALWEPDEGRYAEIAREMALSGDLVTPRNDYIRYFEKPPLVYWAQAGAIRIFGSTEFAVRLPAALFTVGEVALVCAIGDAMFGAAAGLLAALALALAPLVFAFVLTMAFILLLVTFRSIVLPITAIALNLRGYERAIQTPLHITGHLQMSASNTPNFSVVR